MERVNMVQRWKGVTIKMNISPEILAVSFTKYQHLL